MNYLTQHFQVSEAVIRSQDSSVSIVTRLRAGWPTFDFRQEQQKDILCSPRRPDRLI